jgi:hypothetical protein
MKISKIFPSILIGACAVGFATQIEARTPPPKQEPATSPTVAPKPNPRLSPASPRVAPDSTPKYEVVVADLIIEKVSQTSPDFWIVRVKNIGKGEAGATTLAMKCTIPKKEGAFPGGTYPAISFPTSPVKAGGVTDVNCKMGIKTSKGMRCQFTVNPDKSIKESNYNNNTRAALANPDY